MSEFDKRQRSETPSKVLGTKSAPREGIEKRGTVGDGGQNPYFESRFAISKSNEKPSC